MFEAAQEQLKRIVARLYERLCLAFVTIQVKSARSRRDFSSIKIVSAFQRHNGITAGAELQSAAMNRLGIQAEMLDATAVIRNPMFRLRHTPGTAYIFHAGGPNIPNLMLSVLPAVTSAYRIAYLAWELASPPDWPDLSLVIDEIWTTSEFSRQSLLKAGYKIPIQIVPHTIPTLPRRTRKPGPFTVLVMADARSGFMRKNPAGAVAAFLQAFGSNTDAKLILKLTGKGSALVNFDARTRELIDSHANIEVIDGHLNQNEINSLFDRTDVFLSLHRAEGFGIPMLEAMARGIPVIATAYSGNMQFMNENCAIMIGYTLTATMNDAVYGHYTSAQWADPDIEQAAQALKRLATDDTYYEAPATAGYQKAEYQNTVWSLPV